MREVLVSVFALTTFSFTGYGQAAPHKPHAVAAHASKLLPISPAGLRVTHVSLYKNGIGFFEHEGRVDGDESVSLDLTSAQLNDVLQTLTAVDLGGGHITGANYNSTTPLDQQLRTLPLSLGEEPSEEDLYASLRGARVEVSGSGPVFTGRVLSLEIRTPKVGDEVQPKAERRLLTVVSDAGATRTLELTPGTVVRLLDGALRSDLNTYLELLDRHRTEGIRHLTLTDRGTGTRTVRVSFLSEVPVWKSTYRVLLTQGAVTSEQGQTATVQGFSVVDNTTGEDWNNVQLSLIAGNPQSFLQPLAQPMYNRRPEVPIAQNAQFTPQTHESANEGAPQASASASLASSAGGNPNSVFGDVNGTGAGIGPGSGSAMGGGTYHVGRATGGPLAAMPAPPPPVPYETIARDSTAPNASTAAFDDFFAYTLADPVTIPRNGSALVPILQARLPVESVTLWSPSEPQPLRALWLTNSSQLTLDRGSFSVLENGAFAGEGLVDPVHPGERRLLSYAVDQAVRVTPGDRHDTRLIASVSVAKGVLRAANVELASVAYSVSSAATGPRTVVVEEPRRSGWTLDPGTTAAETTPNSYRFRVVVTAGQPAHLSITQRHTEDVYFRLSDNTEEQLTVYLKDNGGDPQVLAQLEPVFAAKRNLAGLDRRIGETESKVQALDADQKRLRENLSALKGSAEERSLARRYTSELNTQEDTLNALQHELDGLHQQRSSASAELSQRIEALQITD